MKTQYILYQWNNHEDLIPYNVLADTFDTVFYSKMPHLLIQAIRFMAEEDVKELKIDGFHIVEVDRK